MVEIRYTCKCGRSVPLIQDWEGETVVFRLPKHSPRRGQGGGFEEASRKKLRMAVCPFSGQEVPRYGGEE